MRHVVRIILGTLQILFLVASLQSCRHDFDLYEKENPITHEERAEKFFRLKKPLDERRLAIYSALKKQNETTFF